MPEVIDAHKIKADRGMEYMDFLNTLEICWRLHLMQGKKEKKAEKEVVYCARRLIKRAKDWKVRELIQIIERDPKPVDTMFALIKQVEDELKMRGYSRGSVFTN